MQVLLAAEVAAAPIADFKDLAEDPHMIARGALTEIDDPVLGKLRMPTAQPRLSETPGRIDLAGLPLGVYNREICIERLGMEEGGVRAVEGSGGRVNYLRPLPGSSGRQHGAPHRHG